MKNIFLFSISFLFWGLSNVKAQNGYQYIDFNFTYLDKPFGGINGTVALDFAGKYHDGYEIYLEAFKSKYTRHLNFISDTVTKIVNHVTLHSIRYNYTGGFIYKPLLFRSSNLSFRLKTGLGIGSDTNNLLVETIAGFELSRAMKGGFELVLEQNNAYVFNDTQVWRSGLAMGIKIPLL